MMGPRQEAQGALFYEFRLDDHVPADHLLRSIDRFVDLSPVRPRLTPFCALASHFHGRRFTQWSDDARELDDHEIDPEETRNLAAGPANASLIEDLLKQLAEGDPK